MKKNKLFHIGDFVVANDGLVGQVIKKNAPPDYPIVVKFNNDFRMIRTYTDDGIQYVGEDEFWIRKLTKLEKEMK